jgi:hypothetical protein
VLRVSGYSCLMFGRKRGSSGDQRGREVFRSLRSQAVTVSPSSIGISQDTGRPSVFGVVMDTTYLSGTATLAVLADGTVGLYTSTGGRVIGGGSHERVAAAARELLAVAEGHLAAFAQGGSDDLPPAGGTLITLRTHAGPRRLSAREEDLGLNRHPASPVFRSAHQVIAELRMIESGTGRDRAGTGRFSGGVTPLMAAAHLGDQQAAAH